MILKLPWDKNEKDFFKFLKIIENPENVLDIGANIGVMTYHFANKFNKANVYSFEPVPVNKKILQRIIAKFKLNNVKVYPFALGESESKIQMIMPESNKVYFHGLSHVKQNRKNEKGLIYDVELKKLDDLQDFKNIKVDAIKVDVEDFEYHVLKGGENLIRKNRPLIYAELWNSENKDKSLKFLRSLNYRVFININNRLQDYKGQKGFQNYFFIPNDYGSDLKL